MTVAKRMDPNKSEEARECYELSLAGFSQRQIADKLGHSQSWVRDRLKLHIENRVHPKADEFRAKQIDRAQIYIRSLWSAILAGDPKAIAQAVRTEERIAKLLGLDSATAFKVEIEKTDDTTEVQKMMDHFFGSSSDKTEPKIIPHIDVTTRRKRPMKETPAIQYAAPSTADEFAKDATFAAHEVQPEAIQLGDDSDFEPIKVDPAAFKRSRRGKPIPNPAERFLRDSDD